MYAPEDMPLMLVAEEPGALPDIRAAVALWGRPLPGWNPFLEGDVLPTEQTGSSVVSVRLVLNDRGEAEVRRRGCEVESATIYLPMGARRSVRRLAHEMGHLLRLRHSDSCLDLMHPDGAVCGERIPQATIEALVATYPLR